jgi:hypothetical protein
VPQADSPNSLAVYLGSHSDDRLGVGAAPHHSFFQAAEIGLIPIPFGTGIVVECVRNQSTLSVMD